MLDFHYLFVLTLINLKFNLFIIHITIFILNKYFSLSFYLFTFFILIIIILMLLFLLFHFIFPIKINYFALLFPYTKSFIDLVHHADVINLIRFNLQIKNSIIILEM